MKSTEQFFLACGTIYFTVQGVVLNFQFVDETLVCDHSNKSYIEQYFHVVLFIMLYVQVNFNFCVCGCDHSNEGCRAFLSYGIVCYAVQDGSRVTSVDETPVCDHSNESY